MSDPGPAFAVVRLAAGALFLDAGRVLLVHPAYKDSWEVPGGCVEPGESPAAACRRELAEELGLHRPTRRLLSVDWAPNERDGDKLLFLFDCGPLGEDEHRLRLPPDELDGLAWVGLDDLDRYLIPRLARRVRTTIGLADADNIYLEHGVRSGPTQPGSGTRSR